MRKLIVIEQEDIVVCDNKNCDFKVPNKTGKPDVDIKKYLNVPCPKCGENLLTEEDYSDFKLMVRAINWINKWFGWITIFIPKNKKKVKGIAKAHKGISIEMDDECCSKKIEYGNKFRI